MYRKPNLTIKELKKMIAEYSDDTEILIELVDFNYSPEQLQSYASLTKEISHTSDATTSFLILEAVRD